MDDLSVIFFTDGCAGNTKIELSNSLAKLTQSISHFKSRCLTIGFTKSHDAVLLNSIAKAGSELGNFIYVDTDKQDY